ncbi:hypothetical protein EDC04DRAFT_2709856 [Pisolithus marmoratus]|nr:hypothetical protein EDC04DRAFT_2709856 [Pisolithus marmoratus]
MPSSPFAPPASPPSRDLVEFMDNGRTLEWACAAARRAEKEVHAELSTRHVAHYSTNEVCGDERRKRISSPSLPREAKASIISREVERRTSICCTLLRKT